MAEGNSSGSTAIVAIFAILVIGALVYFFVLAPQGGGGANIVIPIATP
jgi:hypothetical protein